MDRQFGISLHHLPALLVTDRAGEYEMDGGRVATGVVLTPVTMVLDLAMLIALACSAGDGDSVSGLDLPWPGGGSQDPISVAERDRYWQSLTTAAPPASR